MNKLKGILSYYFAPSMAGLLLIGMIVVVIFQLREATANTAVNVATTNLMMANAVNESNKRQLEEESDGEKATRTSNPTAVIVDNVTPKPGPTSGLRVKASCNKDIARIHREPGYYVVNNDTHYLILDDGRRFIFPKQQCILEY